LSKVADDAGQAVMITEAKMAKEEETHFLIEEKGAIYNTS
jgi:hypothetical protein